MNIKRIACITISALALSALSACSKLTYEEYKSKVDKCEKEMHGKVKVATVDFGYPNAVYCITDGFKFEVK